MYVKCAERRRSITNREKSINGRGFIYSSDLLQLYRATVATYIPRKVVKKKIKNFNRRAVNAKHEILESYTHERCCDKSIFLKIIPMAINFVLESVFFYVSSILYAEPAAGAVDSVAAGTYV